MDTAPQFGRGHRARVTLGVASICASIFSNKAPSEACQVANIKSQKKRNKTNEIARQRNKAVKAELRTHVRAFRTAVAEGNNEKAVALAQVASRSLDRAVSKGVIHSNQAANRKSAISSTANALA